jgi:hypothetical protein
MGRKEATAGGSRRIWPMRGLLVLLLATAVAGFVLYYAQRGDEPQTPVSSAECRPTDGSTTPGDRPPDARVPPEGPADGILDRLVSLIGPDDAESAESDVIWDADLESGQLFPPYADGVEEGNGSEATVEVTDAPAGEGNAVRMEMPPSRGTEEDVPNRKFLKVPDFSFRSGDEFWYGIRLYFDDDWQLSEISDDGEQFTSLLSFRYTDASRNGTGSVKIVETESGTPCLVHTRAALSADEYGDGAGEDPLYLGPVVEEEWIDLVCHFKWSHTSEDALKECWRDGQLMGRSTRANMTVDATAITRVGIYEGPGVDHERTLYWDNHRIGRSYEAVDPDR